MHTENNRTIAALATPPGIGGLSVIRVSGDDALTIGDKIFNGVGGKQIAQSDPYSILYGKIMDEQELIDTVTVSVFKAPNSYTGDNTIEIGSHGGNIVYRRILSLLYKHGADPAEPGEFTKKAFINGKMDLTQVEAVADLIHAESEGGAKLAASQLTGSMKAKLSDVNQKLIRAAGLLELELDFSEEEAGFIDREELDQLLESSAEMCRELSAGYQSADILRSGLHVGIVGKPNVGKSTLFNALLGENRAITSNIAGTTRDYIKESLHISGSACYLYDTAGIRESTDTIEIAGIKLVDSVLEKSNIIAILLDLTDELASSESFISAITAKYANQKKIYIVGTKSDLIPQSELSSNKVDLVLSGLKGDGIAEFKAMLAAEIEQSIGKLGNTLVNSRQSQLLIEAEKYIRNAQELNRMGEGNELIGYEIRDAAKELAWITGSRWNEQVLNKVFSGFCIGK